MAKAKYAAGSSTQSVEINSDRKLFICFKFLGFHKLLYSISVLYYGYVTYYFKKFLLLPHYQQFCCVESPFKSFDKLGTFLKQICNL